MKMTTGRERRVLARRLATELSAQELAEVCGQGTSYAGTGGCDSAGRAADIYANDCVNGGDVYKC